MKRNSFLLCVLIAGLCFCLFSCNDSSEDPSQDGATRNESVLAMLDLLDENGSPKTVFAYGENIAFEFKVQNTGSESAMIPQFWEIVGEDLFNVYKANGELVGRPWDVAIGTWKTVSPGLPSGQSYKYGCRWFDPPYIPFDDLENWQGTKEDEIAFNEAKAQGRFFFQYRKRDTLAKGEYYCEFKVTLGGKDVRICKQNFKVE